MILDARKKGRNLATPRYVPEKFKALDYSRDLAMQEAIRRCERPTRVAKSNPKPEVKK